MEKKVKIGDKEYTVKEIKYKDVASLDPKDKAGMSKKIMQDSTGMTDEVYDNLTMKEGIEIMKVVNEINGLEDFMNPQTSSKTN